MKKTSFISALSIGVLSISMAFASPADAVNQVRENSVQVLKSSTAATPTPHAKKLKPTPSLTSTSNA